MLSKHPPTNPVPYQGKLTIANAITDVTRLAGVQGDGAAYPDSSVGVWPEATNHVANGGFETNTTGWSAWNSGASIARSTSQAKFGSASLEVTVASLGSRGARYILSLSATTVYTVSAWMKVPSGVTINMAVYDTTITILLGSVQLAGSGAWQRVSVSFTSDADGGNHSIFLMTFADYGAVVFYVDGVQVETGSIATPYIETDGGTASRSVGRIQAPVSGVFTTTQGWFFLRTKMGFGNASALPVTAPGIMCWSDSTNERIHPFVGIGGWSMRRQTGGAGTDAAISGTWASGDAVSLCGAWTSAAVKGSTNGAAFTSAANATIPTVARSTFDIANNTEATDRPLCASNYWFAAGKGTLTDADAALFHSWGNNDPLPHMFPKSAQLSFLDPFNGDGTFYRRAV